MEHGSPRPGWSQLLLPAVLILGLVLLLNLDAGAPPAEPEQIVPFEAPLKLIIGYLAGLAEIAAAIVIGTAVVRGIITFLRDLLSPPAGRITRASAIRLELGRALVLGLEFTVASDILRTAVAPTRQDILTLGAVVLLRTLLNNFLEREIHEAESYSATHTARSAQADAT